ARRAFARGALAAARSTVRAPVRLLDAATRGWVRRRLLGRDEVAAAQEVDAAVERQLATEGSVLARLAVSIEAQFSAEANPYLDDLVDTFERLWRARRDDGG